MGVSTRSRDEGVSWVYYGCIIKVSRRCISKVSGGGYIIKPWRHMAIYTGNASDERH